MKTLIGGWHPSKAESGIKYNNPGNGLNSALYERPDATGKTGYVYATGGTNAADWHDLAADGLQLIGRSGQYNDATMNAREISNDLKGSELTMVGHSLGGGEAAANALATGRDAITFNAAGLSDATKENLQLNKSAKIDNYDVGGQIVKAQTLIGIKPEGTQHALPTTTTALQNMALGGVVTGVINHLMPAVNSGLNDKK